MKQFLLRFSWSMAILATVAITVVGVGLSSQIHAQAQSYSVLYMFLGGLNGAFPYGALTRDSSGNLFGTTSEFNNGLVFKLDSSQNYSVLHSFAGAPRDGSAPMSAMLGDGAGNYYGTTYSGGVSNFGTIFKVSSTGTESIIHSFAGQPNDGTHPYAALIADQSRNGYGTTPGGGAFGMGTVYQIKGSTGKVTILHSFQGPDGAAPFGPLTIDSSGNLYGATSAGGAFNSGTLFEVNATGNETVLYSFTGGSDGGTPYGGVIRNNSGDIYTTTYSGGANNLGAITKWSLNGKHFVLYSFSGPDGANPYSSIIVDASGNFYGTTFNGGASGLGVAFKLDSKQNYTLLHSFSGGTSDGANPYAPLIRDSSGNLYGVTVYGGNAAAGCTTGCGTIFKIVP